jgi:CBS domain containing-hemolysin-like protein
MNCPLSFSLSPDVLQVKAMSETLVNLLVLAFLVLANAFFVAAEFALVRVRRTRVQTLVASGSSTAKMVQEAIEHLNHYISAI